jgi:hypothetical protein
MPVVRPDVGDAALDERGAIALALDLGQGGHAAQPPGVDIGQQRAGLGGDGGDADQLILEKGAGVKAERVIVARVDQRLGRLMGPQQAVAQRARIGGSDLANIVAHLRPCPC